METRKLRMMTAAIQIENLKCGGCATTIKKGLLSLNAVKEVTVDVENSIVSIISENDDLENMESAKLLARELNCQVINMPKHGHFITEEMGTNEFPELVSSIVN